MCACVPHSLELHQWGPSTLTPSSSSSLLLLVLHTTNHQPPGLMRDRWGITPDTVTYTAAISACERGANCSVALGLLDLMKVRASVE
jgi:hypothetical protein